MNEPQRNGGISRCRLRESIWAYDFALVEMNLYLDTHPDDSGAMELMEAYRRKRQELVDMYEQRFGAYVVTAADVCGDRWAWVDDPWPWEYAFAGRD